MIPALCVLALAQYSPIAIVKHEPIPEMSGIVASQRYPGVLWVHNDSGDIPRVFAIQKDGRVLKPTYETDFWVDEPVAGKKPWPGIRIEDAANMDWEDIASDKDNLYIADCGNNGNARRDLGVYVVKEPNPLATDRIRADSFVRFSYPQQIAFPPKEWEFDCEAMFLWGGKLHFITKHRRGSNIAFPSAECHVYRLNSMATGKVHDLELLDSRKNMGGWVTGADASPDGTKIAVLTHAPVASVWIFTPKRGSERLLSGEARQILLGKVKQVEAVCFTDNNNLLVTNEQREIYHVRL